MRVDKTLWKEQAGFRRGRSCGEQIFTLRNIIEQSLEFQRPLVMNFIDFKKAFDSVHRESLWSIVRGYGIPQRYVNIFQNLYLHSSCCVRTENGTTDFFNIETGVRQYCILSPLLFRLAVDFVMKRVTYGTNFGIRWKDQSRLVDFDFAEEIVLLAESRTYV